MSNYKKRMKKEYRQLKKRYKKLRNTLIKLDAGTLDFDPSCPYGLLRDQQAHMGEYLRILKIRAEIEGVKL